MFLSPKSLKRLVIMSKQGKASTLDPIQHQEMLQLQIDKVRRVPHEKGEIPRA